MIKTLLVKYGSYAGDSSIYDLVTTIHARIGVSASPLRRYKLLTSMLGDWTTPGEVLAELKEYDGGFNLSMGNKTLEVNYAEAEYIYHLLRADLFRNRDDRLTVATLKVLK